MAPKRFLLVGHGGFYNRGCEAIVRTTTQMLREQFPGCELVLASADARNDESHSAAQGLSVIDNWGTRWSLEWFGWQLRKILSRPIPPQAILSRTLRRTFRKADAVLQIGGDNFTSDYGLSAGSGLVGCNEAAFSNDVPLVVWGASIGPFDSPELEGLILSHLRQAALITVRESVTEDYLREHDIQDNVVRVADPAFLLEPDPVDLAPFWPAGERVLAINVSALSCGYRSDGNTDFGRSIAEGVIDEVLTWEGWGVLLVPHVAGDEQYMAPVAGSFEADRRVNLPPALDARQTKYVISQCDALMAARTHATIAGFSSGVPTISLAYSRKAHGINLDLFGHDDWLLDIVEMEDVNTAVSLVRQLAEELDAVAEHLKLKLPKMKQAAKGGAERLAEVIGNGDR